MTVWVTLGELCESSNGESAWLCGVGRTRAVAQNIAREDADNHLEDDDEERILIDGERYGNGWQEGDTNTDWTIAYTTSEHEVRSA